MAKGVCAFSIGKCPILSRKIGVPNIVIPVICVHDLAFFTSFLENTLKPMVELPSIFHWSCLWLSLFYQVLVSPAVKWFAIYNPICILLLSCFCLFLLVGFQALFEGVISFLFVFLVLMPMVLIAGMGMGVGNGFV